MIGLEVEGKRELIRVQPAEAVMLGNLRSALKMRGKKQWELCAEVGVGPSVLSEIIAGRRPIEPQLRNDIALLLNADPEWLFQNVDSIPPVPAEQSQNRS